MSSLQQVPLKPGCVCATSQVSQTAGLGGLRVLIWLSTPPASLGRPRPGEGALGGWGGWGCPCSSCWIPTVISVPLSWSPPSLGGPGSLGGRGQSEAQVIWRFSVRAGRGSLMASLGCGLPHQPARGPALPGQWAATALAEPQSPMSAEPGLVERGSALEPAEVGDLAMPCTRPPSACPSQVAAFRLPAFPGLGG